MKMIIVVVLALVALSAAGPVDVTRELVKILRSEFNQDPEGSYNYGFETENGIKQNEQGELKEVVNEENKPQKVVVVRGFWTYTDPEGKVQEVNYVADENGFRPEGESIPKLAQR